MKTEELLLQGASALGVLLSDDQAKGLTLYQSELTKWMRRINLVAKESSQEEIVERHFLDSLALVPLLPKGKLQNTIRLLDVGSGAGFPGLVLALVLPQANFYLLEPRQKRAIFLRHIVRMLKLKNVEVVCERVETLYEKKGGTKRNFSHITGRAVADAPSFLQMVEPLVGRETEVVLFLVQKKTLDQLPDDLKNHWQLQASRSLILPFCQEPRFLACMRKNDGISAGEAKNSSPALKGTQ